MNSQDLEQGDDFVFRLTPDKSAGNDADFVMLAPKTTEFVIKLKPADLRQLRSYIDSIVPNSSQLSDNEVIIKLANQWRTAAWKIADSLRNELKLAGHFKDESWQTAELTNRQLVEIGQKYSIPFCIYHLGSSDATGHYVLLTSPPRKLHAADQNFTATIYDPIRGGKNKIEISEADLSREGRIIVCAVNPKPIPHYIHGTSLRLALINQVITETNGYDLSIPFYEGATELAQAKMEPLQKIDSYNCGLWCLIYAMTSMAYKQGENIFKQIGFNNIAELSKVLLVRPD